MSLQRMRRMDFPSLISESSAHPLADFPRPPRTTLRRQSDVESDARVDVPEAEPGDYSEENDVSRNQKYGIQVNPFLRYFRDCLCPWGDVRAAEGDHKKKNKCDGEKCDVTLEKPRNRSRPTGSRDPLH